MSITTFFAPRRKRSRFDLIADKAPKRIRPQAEAAALLLDRIATQVERGKTQVERTKTRAMRYRAPIKMTVLGAGAVALLAYGPTRRAAGALGRQLWKELSSFVK